MFCVIFLFKFINFWWLILIGVNVGGMGIIIVLFVSLIFYKFYSKEYDGKKYLYKFIKYNFGSFIIFVVLFFIFLYL